MNELLALENAVGLLSQRLISAEVALDVCLNIFIEENEGFKDKFTEKFKQRMADVRAAMENRVKEQEQQESRIITP